MMSDHRTCERCGEDLPRFDVTTVSDPEPRYLYSPCTCPGPRCPFCNARLGGRFVEDDECGTLHCFMFGHVVPKPVIA